MVLPNNASDTAQGQVRILRSWMGPAHAQQDGQDDHDDLQAQRTELQEREQRQRLAELDLESRLASLEAQGGQAATGGSFARDASRPEGELAAEATQHDSKRDERDAEIQSLQQKLGDSIRDNAELLTHNSALARKIGELQESRRLLFHQYSSHRKHMEVMIRIRPLREEEKEQPVISTQQSRPGRLEVSCPSEPSLADAAAEADSIFDHTATNEDIYLEIVRHPWSLLDGRGVCIAAYGQTGSGKTYMMSYMSREIVAELFRNVLTGDRAGTYTLKARCVEVYLESAYDLLSGGNGANSGAAGKLQVRDDVARGLVTVEGCTYQSVASEEDWESILQQVERSRRTASLVPKGHSISHRSSRSSLILTIIMEGVKDGKKSRAQMDLVDLAGSEGIPESAEGDPALKKETAAINSCLLTLGRVIGALGGRNAHIPYNDHVLTKLLKYSLGNGARSLFLVTASPLAANFLQTKSSLSFSSKVLNARVGRAKANEGDVQKKPEQERHALRRS